MSQPTPRDLLDTLLGYLGFAFEIEEQERDGHLVLQIYTHDAELLIGRRGEILDDLQYLVNRLVQTRESKAPRVIVDVEHHRLMRDDAFLGAIQKIAEAVRATGRPLQTEPLNSYDRYLVHNAFKNDPQISTWSPNDDARLKRVTLRPRQAKSDA